MKRTIAPYLICPACLPQEFPLELRADREENGDVIAGVLSCRKCRRRFPIRDGIAVLLPDPDASPSGGQWRYEEGGTLATYLWSHYADLAGDPEAGSAYADWAGCLATGAETAFDAGCATGRLTFEMAARGALAVGCDLSLSFIRTARQLARDRRLTFSLPREGNLRDTFDVRLPEAWRTDAMEFVVADVLRIPFVRETFAQTSSLNLVDRVRHPLAHLYEMNRVARKSAAFLFSDPFSWSTANTPEEAWLGGTERGDYPGRGVDNVRALLEGKGGIIQPPWTIERQGEVWWKIRSHRNHFELIRSELLVASRRNSR
ncbi:MAG: methyltransferase domain-containing protein [Desulfuromonadales bacterium]|nr:MAG: methyltransferase domain-containing protein [Desulfuromonadales bacterium]